MRKNKQTFYLLIICCLLVFTGCSAQSPKKEPIKKEPLHIVAVGDSLTEGVGSKKGGYVQFVKEKLEKNEHISTVSVENYGIRGYRTDQLLDYLGDPKVKQSIQKADLVLLTIGGNDMVKVVKSKFFNLNFEDFDEENKQFGENLQQIFSLIHSYNKQASIYLVGLYNPFAKSLKEFEEINIVIDRLNLTSQKVIKKNSYVSFVPVDDLFINPKENLLFDDNFHPNDKGYSLIADRVVSTVLKNEKIFNKNISKK